MVDIKQTYCDSAGKEILLKAKEISVDLVTKKHPIDTTPYYCGFFKYK